MPRSSREGKEVRDEKPKTEKEVSKVLLSALSDHQVAILAAQQRRKKKLKENPKDALMDQYLMDKGILRDEDAKAIAASKGRKKDAWVDSFWVRLFNILISLVVIANSVEIAVEVDMGASNPDLFFILNNVFVSIYVAETLCRFYYHGLDYLNNWLNRFDFFLVLLSMVDTWILEAQARGVAYGEDGERLKRDDGLESLTLLRVIRLIRLVRLVRLLRLIKELWLVMASLLRSVKALGWVCILLFTLTYVCAIFVNMILSEALPNMVLGPRVEGETLLVRDPFSPLPERLYKEYFGSVWRSCFSLFQMVLGRSGDQTLHLLRPLSQEMPGLYGFILLYVWIARYGFLNMVLGVIVSNTIEIEKDREATMYEKKLAEQREILNSLASFFESVDFDGSGSVDRDEFKLAFSMPAVAEMFQRLDLSVNDPDALFNILDADQGGDIDLNEFLSGCMRLKQASSSRDILQTHLNLRAADQQGDLVNARADELNRSVSDLYQRLQFIYTELDLYTKRCKDPVVVMRREGHIDHMVPTEPPRGARLESTYYRIDQLPVPAKAEEGKKQKEE